MIHKIKARMPNPHARFCLYVGHGTNLEGESPATGNYRQLQRTANRLQQYQGGEAVQQCAGANEQKAPMQHDR